MKITKLEPSGFCFGVKRSYLETLNTLKTYQNRKIYLLGWLVHNKNVIKELKDLNLILLEDKLLDRYQIVEQLPNTNNEDVIILSAHGTDYHAIELAKSKGYKVIDLTCPFVYKTHLLIKQKLKEGYEVYFIGKQNHPETKAILKIDKNIHLITSLDDIQQYEFKANKIFCTNQTTLSIFEMKILIDALKKKQASIEFVNDICNATTLRQQAIHQLTNDVDLILVIGDYQSSNSNELWKLAKQKCDSYLINNYEDINLEWFKNKKHCVLISAASSPENVINDTMRYIEEKINGN